MENYEWQKNKAVVDRMYYSERIFTTSTLFAGIFTAINLTMMRSGFFQKTMSARILPTWLYWAGINVVCTAVLLKPLTKEEIAIQWHKRRTMGKYLYSLYHLDGPQEQKTE